MKYPEGKQGGYYIRRRLAYVVGRSVEVESWEVPARGNETRSIYLRNERWRRDEFVALEWV